MIDCARRGHTEEDGAGFFGSITLVNLRAALGPLAIRAPEAEGIAARFAGAEIRLRPLA